MPNHAKPKMKHDPLIDYAKADWHTSSGPLFL